MSITTAVKVKTPVSKCRAKDPSKCAFHGVPEQPGAVTAASLLREYTTEKASKTVPASTSRVNQAINSSLQYDGVKPVWWDEYSAACESNTQLPHKPELLDVIESPAGPLAVIWQEQSQENNDAGVTLNSGMDLNVCYYKSMSTGETLGYVKMTSMSDSSIERSFGKDEFTPWRFAERFSGRQYGFRDYKDKNPEGLDYGKRNLHDDELTQFRRNLWVNVQRNDGNGIRTADGNYVASYSVNSTHVPVDDAAVQNDLKKLAKTKQKGMKNSITYHSTPYVDFSKVDHKLKGQGFGAALYVYTAKRLAQQGQVLRGSGIQSDEAQELWGKFREKLPQNVSTISLDYKGTKSTAPILDFRK